MPIDELRGELTTLADEIDPFAGDVRAVHHRVRVRRVAGTALVAAIVVVVAASTVAVVGHRRADKVNVSGTGPKEVSSALITHIDAIVVPATPAVKTELDASPLVRHYAFIPAADRSGPSSSLLTTEPVKSALCQLQTSDGYAVDAATPGQTFDDGLVRALSGSAHVTITEQFSADAEIFMQQGIAREYSLAIEGQLAADADVQSFRYISNADAYEIFKQDFAAQPALIESTKPSDLPESFRITVKPDRAVATVVERYKSRDGVDTTITPSLVELFHPRSAINDSGKRISPCS